MDKCVQNSAARVQQRVSAHPQQIATRNVYERVGVVELFLFEFMNGQSDSFRLAKNDFKVQQVGSSKGCAHIRNKLHHEHAETLRCQRRNHCQTRSAHKRHLQIWPRFKVDFEENQATIQIIVLHTCSKACFSYSNVNISKHKSLVGPICARARTQNGVSIKSPLWAKSIKPLNFSRFTDAQKHVHHTETLRFQNTNHW